MEKLSIILGKSVQKVTRLRGNGGQVSSSKKPTLISSKKSYQSFLTAWL